MNVWSKFSSAYPDFTRQHLSMNFLVPLLILHLIAASNSAAGNGDPSLLGFWVTGERDWVVEITNCPTGFCGKLVGLSQDARPNVLRTDTRNPKRAKRGLSLCGLSIMGSFHPSKDTPRQWEGGWVYDPQNGKTYSGKMRLDGPDTLKVRGYVLFPLFGRDKTLSRETGPINRCSSDL